MGAVVQKRLTVVNERLMYGEIELQFSFFLQKIQFNLATISLTVREVSTVTESQLELGESVEALEAMGRLLASL